MNQKTVRSLTRQLPLFKILNLGKRLTVSIVLALNSITKNYKGLHLNIINTNCNVTLWDNDLITVAVMVGKTLHCTFRGKKDKFIYCKRNNIHIYALASGIPRRNFVYKLIVPKNCTKMVSIKSFWKVRIPISKLVYYFQVRNFLHL